jgi:hypothetical protein
MHIIESQHNLMNNINHLTFRKRTDLGKSLEQLTALHELRYHIVVLRVFNLVNHTNEIGVTLLTQDRKLVLKKLNVNFLLFNCLLLHDLDGESFT